MTGSPLPLARAAASPRPGARRARFGIDPDAYAAKVGRILSYLAAGDAYQVNFTDSFAVEPEGPLHELYLALRHVQRARYGAYLRCDELEVACFSPELHFELSEGRLITRPMKGTAPRGRTLEEDEVAAARLHRDPKNRAENVMIVDLLRNDLGRVCRYGSVQVPRLFEVEAVGPVLQMTSTVTGELREGTAFGELMDALFPSGSVTGAPKRRAMEIIRELERGPRGVYTGAIGWLGPGGEGCFNVAIRTAVRHSGRVVFGGGSGIVIDSHPAAEYDECLLKARFLQAPSEPFELMETIRCHRGHLLELDAHLARLARSAGYFGFPCDRDGIRRAMDDQAARLGDDRRVRLLLDRQGLFRVESQPLAGARLLGDGLPPSWVGPVPVGLASESVDSRDPLLYHKTTLRGRFDEAAREADRRGLADLLFFNERGELTEGSISNVFVEESGELLTPPVSCGLLPGIGRARVLAEHPAAREEIITLERLRAADAIYLCSALRGLRRVELLEP